MGFFSTSKDRNEGVKASEIKTSLKYSIGINLNCILICGRSDFFPRIPMSRWLLKMAHGKLLHGWKLNQAHPRNHSTHTIVWANEIQSNTLRSIATGCTHIVGNDDDDVVIR